MKNKKYLLLIILLFPAALKLFLEFTTINSKKLPFYGEKIAYGKDTVYQKVNSTFFNLPAHASNLSGLQAIEIDTINYPIFVVCFVSQKYKKDNYRLAGLSEYAQYKRDKIKEIPFFIITPCDGLGNESCFRELEKLSVGNKNIINLYWKTPSYDSLSLTYFRQKPYYIDYSYFCLIDKQRHIRGYYDARYVSEIKRLIEEYQHLRLKEEKDKMVSANKIEN